MALSNFRRLKEKKKSYILESINKCFSHYSYDELSINDIIKMADISRGSFYNYFEDKRDAVSTMILHRIEIFINKLKIFIAENNDSLFEGVLSYHNYVLELFENEEVVRRIKNIRYYNSILNGVIMSNNNEEIILNLNKWLIENTIEGKTYLSELRKMHNTMLLLSSLVINDIVKVIHDSNLFTADDFRLKFEIIKAGAYHTK